jgi:hypothetical protein
MLTGFQQANSGTGFGEFIGGHTATCSRADNNDIVGICGEIELYVLHSRKIIRIFLVKNRN